MVNVKEITSAEDLETAFNIREKVFVEEQQVSREEEYDQYEPTSRHYLLEVEGEPAGTARWRFTENGIKLERFAVLSTYRNRQAGSALLRKVLQDVGPVSKGKMVYLHAQLPAVSFYERQGFAKTGPEFLECDIRHYKMVWQQPQSH